MYSEVAQARRRCTGTRKDGQPCRAYACWDDPEQRCVQHAGRGHTGPQELGRRYREAPRGVMPCRCVAYNWPHRPGAGFCRWPEAPTQRRTTPVGSHRAGTVRRRIRNRSVYYEYR